MKKYVFLLMVMATLQSAVGQVKILGIVKDNKGNAVAGASIAIKDSYDGATTDSSGRFNFKSDEKGPHLLITSSIGFNSVEQPITIGESAIELNIICEANKR